MTEIFIRSGQSALNVSAELLEEIVLSFSGIPTRVSIEVPRLQKGRFMFSGITIDQFNRIRDILASLPRLQSLSVSISCTAFEWTTQHFLALREVQPNIADLTPPEFWDLDDYDSEDEEEDPSFA